ncbi:sensor histidine kinase [Corynebacterium lowii]|uniref:Sensor histidine kinase DesK n=1 Tax=Corynebacterium lowii TaxID=1544413 RepID=A0A0Q0UDX1_9CORY|nr:histidine kinase [Corynebacterium lowii]KQB86062.1 Sensor histidine kinase DesK [Corynebacterium lowii]MDP9852534.1 two-component system sensor histidine kinase DesK [Corynebacterium lowii]
MPSPIAERLKPLTHPRRSWAALPNPTKFTLYTRVSLQVLTIFFLLFPSTDTSLFPHFLYSEANLTEEIIAGISAKQILSLLLLSAVIVSTNVFLARVPELNPNSTKDHHKVFRVGFILTLLLLLWGMSIALPDLHNKPLGLVIFSTSILALDYLPFIRHTWKITALLSLILAGLFLLSFQSNPTIGESDFRRGFFLGFILVYPAALVALTRLSLWSVNIIKQAERSAELQRSLTLTEERLRFAQEMHDTLGQNLAAINMKTELASALAQHNDSRLHGELTELQSLTRATITDMREVIKGYRNINLNTEIEGATSLLQSAGIRFNVTGSAETIPHRYQELSAWLVREATTNILKHSAAITATLNLDSASISILNDGAPTATKPLRLGGLKALEQRAYAQHNARLSIKRKGGDFCLTLHFDSPSGEQNPEERPRIP